MSQVAGSGAGGYLAQLRELLRDQHVSRARVLAMLEEASSGEITRKGETLLASVDEGIRDLERDIARAERTLVRRHAPELHLRTVRLDREIAAIRLQVCANARPRRGGSVHRARRTRTARTSRGSPAGRLSADDPDPLDPPARVIYAHAAAWRGDPRVGWWLESWGDEATEDAA